MARVRFPSSLRGRLLALVLVAVLPSFGILFYAERNHRRLMIRQVEDEAHDLARLVAERHQRAVDRARGLLVGLTRLPSLRALDGPACSRDVAAVLAEAAPSYANVGAATPDGSLFCSAAPLAAPVNLADRVHVRGPLDRGVFTVGGHITSRSRAGLASFGIGLPVRDGSGAVVAVAVASLDLVQLQRELDELPLPPGAEVVVVDRDGVIATGRPAPAGGGAPLAGPLAAATLAHAPAAELDGLDGVRRVYGFHEVGAGGEVAMRVAAGIPAEAAYAPVDRIVRASVLAFLAVAAFAIAAALLGTDLLVVRPVRAVVAASRRIAAGDHAARSGLAPRRGEIGELVHAFDEMAGSLEGLWRQNRLLLDAVGEGILGIGADGRITFANPAAARTLGWSVEEMLGADAHALVHGKRPDGTELPADACPILAAMRERGPRRHADETLWRRDGTSFPAEIVSTPLEDGGRVVGLVLVFRDVSERTRLEERLRQAEKMEAIGQLAGGVAHDFNNLLTAIVSCAQLIGEAVPEDHPAQADAREIGIAAGRAAALTRQLLAFGRRQRLAPRLVELRAVVRAMESMLRRLLPATVSLRVDTPRAGTVLADPAQIELVVLNLVVNARDAVGEGGRIEVRVEEVAGEEDDGLAPGPKAVLVVKDDGSGMDAATRERIFEPFFTTKPVGKGTGLGLATVYGVVSQSGGAVRVRSEPGHGAEFRISLPLRPAAEAEPDRPAPAPPGSGAETVLLVEDDAAIRGIVRRALARAGYRVLDAGSAGDALQIARGEPGIHALVTDVVLPERNGWDLSREVARGRPGLRVLFMSGYAAQPTGEALLPDGVPFLAKPFTPDDLLRSLRAVLDAPAAHAASSAPNRSA
jgi:PAS domain S-box-containing protein